MHQFLFYNEFLYSSTCFEHNRAHHQEVKIVSRSIWHPMHRTAACSVMMPDAA